MNYTRLVVSRLLSWLAILGLMTFGSAGVGTASGQASPMEQGLVLSVVADPYSASILVEGENFTPGGAVYIALYDVWGETLRETRWVSASESSFGPNGSQDPALGYVGGGIVRERFQLSDEHFGPNGSRDPALGIVFVADDSAVTGICLPALMVRAYDQQATEWSDSLDVGLNVQC